MQPRIRSKALHIGLAGMVLAGAALALSLAPAQRPAEADVAWDACGTSDALFVGQSDALNKTSFEGLRVVELSGIAYDQARQVYYVNADRVSGSATSRFFTMNVPVSGDGLGVPSIEAVTVLQKADGSNSTGADADNEGIALSNQDELFLASEGRTAGSPPNAIFQTAVRRYALDGTLLGSIAVPARFLVPLDGAGVSNLSFESMALGPDGRSLFTANEAPLTTDGVTTDRRGRIRILRFEDRGPDGFVPVQEFFYLMEPDRNASGALEVGVAEIIATSETDLLVLERGFIPTAGNTIRIFKVSLAGAQDVSQQASLDAAGLVPLAKRLLVDLVTCPSGGAVPAPGAIQPNPLLENYEGMTLGPVLPGGHRALVLISDDNDGATQKTRIVVLAVPLPELVGQD